MSCDGCARMLAHAAWQGPARAVVPLPVVRIGCLGAELRQLVAKHQCGGRGEHATDTLHETAFHTVNLAEGLAA